MCGIIGFISTENSCEQMLEANCGAILPRGISFDKYISSNLALGYSRLPTDGIEDAKLNTIGASEATKFLFNGLITNVDYLVKRFSLTPEAAISDTKCLKEGYEKYGKEFLQSCRGMFAFTYISSEEIVLVRDTVGIKPMYYIKNKEFFGFCSELKGLINMDGGIIREVLPGEIVTFNRKSRVLKKSKFVYKSYKHFKKNELEEAIVESVIIPTRRYLRQTPNKKIGVLLSGGLDSSLIVQVLANELSEQDKKRVVCFSIGISASRDVFLAKKLAKKLGFKCIHVKPYGLKQAASQIKELVFEVESPFSRVVKVGLLQKAVASKMNSVGIEVAISGDGADELYFGYERFINGLNSKQIIKVYKSFFKKVFYSTLLQRFDRIFAREQIEGRVPLLDQELIEISKRFSPEEKIDYIYDSGLSKLPLRIVAKKIGLPEAVYSRMKERTLMGAMNKNNSEEKDGYLEEYFEMNKKMKLKEYISNCYRDLFIEGKSSLSKASLADMEENTMRVVKQFILDNRAALLEKQPFRRTVREEIYGTI